MIPSIRCSRACIASAVALALLVILLPSTILPLQAADHQVIPIWPGSVPGEVGKIGPERVRDAAEAPTKTAKWITNVTRPELHIFDPATDHRNGTALIICPGGGYWNLAWDLEGEEVAARFSQAGITTFVLKYRVPRREGQPERLPAPGPLLDAQRAVSLVRSRAAEWQLDTNRIGIIGFSAGGHLALSAATQFGQRGYQSVDDADRASCRPNFAIAVYPGYFIEQQPAGKEINTDRLAPYIQVAAQTPPILLVHASDDPVASSDNSALMYLALKRANIPAEIHLYTRGGHGFGVRDSGLPCARWPDDCLAWLADQGLLTTPRSK